MASDIIGSVSFNKLLLQGSNFITQVAVGLKWGVLIGGILGIAYYAWYLSQFKHTIVLRRVAGGRRLINVDKFRVVKKSGTETFWWQLKKNKRLIPPARAEVIDIDRLGRMFVECYELEEDARVFAHDRMKPEQIEAALNDQAKGCVITAKKMLGLGNASYDISPRQWLHDSLGETELKAGFEPFTTQDRLILMDQYAKSELERPKNFWRDTFPALAPAGVVILLVVLLVSFWGNLNQPMQSALGEVRNLISETRQLVIDANALRQGVQPVGGPQPTQPEGLPEAPH